MTIGQHDNSQISVSPGGTCFEGRDGVALFRAIALRSGLRLYAKTGMRPNRMWTPTAMLQAATGYTGQKYRRGQHEKAAADLTLWIDAMRAAIPVVVEGQ